MKTDIAAIIEVAYNDTQQSSTGQTPFYINYGNHLVSIYRNADTNNPPAEDHIEYLIRLQEAIRDVIHDAHTIQQRHTDKHRHPSPEIKVEDQVTNQGNTSGRRSISSHDYRNK